MVDGESLLVPFKNSWRRMNSTWIRNVSWSGGTRIELWFVYLNSCTELYVYRMFGWWDCACIHRVSSIIVVSTCPFILLHYLKQLLLLEKHQLVEDNEGLIHFRENLFRLLKLEIRGEGGLQQQFLQQPPWNFWLCFSLSKFSLSYQFCMSLFLDFLIAKTLLCNMIKAKILTGCGKGEN